MLLAPIFRPSRLGPCAVALALSLPLAACDSAELEKKVSTLQTKLSETEAALEEAEANMVSETEKKAAAEALAAAEEKLGKLEEKLEAAKGEKGALESQLKTKEEALAAIKALEDSLAATLVAEIESGEISVKERHGYLVVNVSDKVLFATGSAELSDRGKKVIAKLAESLKSLPDEQVFQVGGHTDNQPIKSDDVLAKFPTNWELSTARATTVVRMLEEEAGIPGERLVAAGFSQFRPVAKNKNAKNRKKNRRIEIALLPPRG